MSWLSSLFKSGKAAPQYKPTPYGGARPPEIDVNGTNYLRGTQAEIQDLVSKRARGEDVGYSPEWMSSSQALIKSNLDRALADRTRTTAGSLSASGLSGNPRAYEATTGRAQRDYSTDLGNSMSALTIADMERKNQERDVNTARLQDLNTFNFGQENTGANFDLSKWVDENQMSLSAANLGASNYWKGITQADQMISDIGQGIGAAGGAMSPSPTMSMSPSATALTQPAGQGIAPSGFTGNFNTSLAQSPEYKAKLARYMV